MSGSVCRENVSLVECFVKSELLGGWGWGGRGGGGVGWGGGGL